jgi:hypothetical protein
VQFEEIMNMDAHADKINKEVAEVSFMESDGTTVDKDGQEGLYDWQLLDHIVDSSKLVYLSYDKLAGMDPNARTAAKKLRQRILIGI